MPEEPPLVPTVDSIDSVRHPRVSRIDRGASPVRVTTGGIEWKTQARQNSLFHAGATRVTTDCGPSRGGKISPTTVPLPHGGLKIPHTSAGINVISLILRVVPFETELQIRRQAEVAAALSTGAT